MHVIKSHQTSVTLFCRDGSSTHYPSLKAARAALGLNWIGRNVAEQFRTYSHTRWRNADNTGYFCGGRNHGVIQYSEKFYNESNFVMRDDAGAPVTYAMVYEDHRQEELRTGRWYRSCCAQWNGEGPVPGISKRRRRWYGRAIRYANALRGAETFKEEGEVALRTSRAKSLNPSLWSETRVASRDDRSWKNYRNTQRK